MDECDIEPGFVPGNGNTAEQTFPPAKLRRFAPVAAILFALFGVMIAFIFTKSADSSSKRVAAIPAQPLDLKSYYHTPASQFFNGRFPWGEVPRGKQTFGNVPLAVDGAIYLWGELNAKRGQVFPEQVDSIAVGRKFETLYVFHGAFMSAPDGSPVYRLTMHFADGSTSETAICYGTHVRDWYESPTSKTDLTDLNSKFVWRIDHPMSTTERPIKLRFSITSIANPKPSLAVESISVASAKGKAAGCILAMTTGPADLLKVKAEGNELADKEKRKE